MRGTIRLGLWLVVLFPNVGLVAQGKSVRTPRRPSLEVVGPSLSREWRIRADNGTSDPLVWTFFESGAIDLAGTKSEVDFKEGRFEFTVEVRGRPVGRTPLSHFMWPCQESADPAVENTEVSRTNRAGLGKSTEVRWMEDASRRECWVRMEGRLWEMVGGRLSVVANRMALPVVDTGFAHGVSFPPAFPEDAFKESDRKTLARLRDLQMGTTGRKGAPFLMLAPMGKATRGVRTGKDAADMVVEWVEEHCSKRYATCRPIREMAREARGLVEESPFLAREVYRAMWEEVGLFTARTRHEELTYSALRAVLTFGAWWT